MSDAIHYPGPVERAKEALAAYEALNGVDENNGITDLIADLLHLSHREAVADGSTEEDAPEAVRLAFNRAWMHYEEESSDPVEG